MMYLRKHIPSLKKVVNNNDESDGSYIYDERSGDVNEEDLL